MFLQPLKHNARKDFFPPFHRLPILHLPFPSQPCGHKGSSISVNRIKSSIDPASHSILQDTPFSGPNKASKPFNLAVSAPLTQDILLFLGKEDTSFTSAKCPKGPVCHAGQFGSCSSKPTDLFFSLLLRVFRNF